MAKVPHRLIEGCLIAAHAIECKRRLHLHPRRVPGRVRDPRARGRRGARRGALRRRRDHRVPRRRRVHLRRGDGAARLARGPARPAAAAAAVPAGAGPLQRADADQQRLHDRDGAVDHRDRRRRSSRRSASESSPGTAIFSISGNVVRPGNYELELGTPMRELIYDFAGGIADGRELKAVIPGGSSVPALSPDQIDVPLDYDSLGAIGTFFGAASLIVVDDRCCMVQLALRSTKFYMHESCGKCTPCREGTRWMVQILERLEAGTRDARGHRPAALGRLAHPRQVALRARRLRRVPGRELRREVGRGVRGARRARAAARSTASRRSRGSSRRATRTRRTATGCTRERARASL